MFGVEIGFGTMTDIIMDAVCAVASFGSVLN